MIALWKKDRPWLLTFLGLGVVVTVLSVSPFPGEQWWRGRARTWPHWYLLPCLLVPFVCGLYAGMRDRLLGTREYLLQRPVSAARIFWSRVAASLLVLGASVALPLILWCATPWASWRSAEALPVLGNELVLATIVWPAFALGLYAATLPGSRLTAVVQTFFVGVPVLFIASRVPFPIGDSWYVSSWLVLGVNATLATVLLVLAERHFVRGYDRDHDLRPALKAFSLFIVCTSAMMFSTFALGEAQYTHGRQASGVKAGDASSGFRSPSPELEPRKDLQHRGHGIGGAWFELLEPSGWLIDAFVSPHERMLYVFASHDKPLGLTGYSRTKHTMVTDGRIEPVSPWFGRVSFPAGTTFEQPGKLNMSLYLLRTAPYTTFLAERERAWVVEGLFTDAARCVPLKLPDGDKFRRLQYLIEGIELVGVQATYGWQDGKVVPLEDTRRRRQVRAWSPPNPDPTSEPWTFQRIDPLAFEGARQPHQESSATIVKLCTVARSPLSAVLSIDRTAGPAWLFDPMIASGWYYGLLIWNLVLAAALSAFSWWRLRVAGASKATRWIWLVAIALGGVSSFLVYLAVERRRAHRPVTIRPSEQRPALLIQSV